MARPNSEIRSTPSVLDRLIDDDPRASTEAPKSRSSNLIELKNAVRRDLEWLLNTRCHLDEGDGLLEEAPRSVAFYGLPDFTGVSARNSVEIKDLITSVEKAIRIFEPRFLDLKVTMEPVDELDRQLRFRIEARLDVEPAPEPIAFDSVLQVGSGGFAVTEK
jgi:type VI secretion system protein ImpF